MKSKTIIIIFVVIAFALGTFSGLLLSVHFTSKLSLKAALYSETNKIIITVKALEKLREGNNEKAITILETTLDSSINALNITYSKQQLESDETIKKVLDQARKYRKKYPYN